MRSARHERELQKKYITLNHMACILAPTAAAIITTAIRKNIPAKYNINGFLAMLWGGVLMLLVDHVISGEIVAYPPFLTAGVEKIVPEIFQVGVPMTIVVFVAWMTMLVVAAKSNKPVSKGKTI